LRRQHDRRQFAADHRRHGRGLDAALPVLGQQQARLARLRCSEASGVRQQLPPYRIEFASEAEIEGRSFEPAQVIVEIGEGRRARGIEPQRFDQLEFGVEVGEELAFPAALLEFLRRIGVVNYAAAQADPAASFGV